MPVTMRPARPHYTDIITFSSIQFSATEAKLHSFVVNTLRQFRNDHACVWPKMYFRHVFESRPQRILFERIFRSDFKIILIQLLTFTRRCTFKNGEILFYPR